MPWERTPRKRSYPCNGDLLKQRRQRRDWTQEDLAGICQYSVRLIAKAEAGGTLHPDTLERLAAALSTPADPLFPEDLASDPKKLALEFLKHLKQDQAQVVSRCQHFLADDIKFFMPGDPAILPFAGHHRGLDEMDRACAAFFGVMEFPRLDEWQTEFAVCEGNEVVVGQWVPGQLRGLSAKGVDVANKMLVVCRMVFERGKIVTFNDYFAHEATESAVLEQQKLLKSAG